MIGDRRTTDSLWSVNFNADGTRVAIGDQRHTATIWDTGSGKAIAWLQHEKQVLNTSFSADGRRAVTASADRTARILDATTGKPVGESLRHDAEVWQASFSPDSARVVTASADKTARIWDAATGRPIGEPMRHEAAVLSASFSPDGSRVLTVGEDKAVHIWEAMPCPPLDMQWVDKLIEAVAGYRFSNDGVLEPVSVVERMALRDSLTSAEVTDPDWRRTIAWLFAPPEQRTVSPLSRQTVRDVANRDIGSGDESAIRKIWRCDPRHPLIQIALAAFETDETRGTFLRNYGLDRLPADAKLWKQAAEMLLAQEEESMASRAVEQVAQLDPASAAALRTPLQVLHETGRHRRVESPPLAASAAKAESLEDIRKALAQANGILLSKYAFLADAEGSVIVDLHDTVIKDFSALRELPIKRLKLNGMKSVDLAQIKDLQVEELWLVSTRVSDLSPLKGMKLKSLAIAMSDITDLSPLIGMPLQRLFTDKNPRLTDLSALSQIPTLEDILLPSENVDCEPLRELPNLKFIGTTWGGVEGEGSGVPAAEFWAGHDREGKK